MTTLQKLSAIEKAKCIYDIYYRRAGVAFCFYHITEGCNGATWKGALHVGSYYKTFTQAVNAEYRKMRETK